MNLGEKYQQLEGKLKIYLKSEPFEDGMTHPAEEIISEFLREPRGQEQIEKLFDNYYEKETYFAQGIIHCLRYINLREISSVGYSIAKKGLKHEDGMIRQLSVSELENWAGEEALNILTTHNESNPLLRRYISKVIADLRS